MKEVSLRSPNPGEERKKEKKKRGKIGQKLREL